MISCRDCKHYRYNARIAACAANDAERYANAYKKNPYDGRTTYDLEWRQTITYARSEYGICGDAARLFEPASKWRRWWRRKFA